jgi:RimJ/RimL family protein N-acetyltransferase
MLQGQKVRLRALEREDLKRLHKLERNIELSLPRDGHWQPLSLSAFEQRFEPRMNADEKSWFAIEADGKVIGSIGLHDQNRLTGVTSFGIGINDPDYIGRGYGREAIALALDWAFRIQNWRRVWLDVAANNERAIRAYQALGFVEEGRQRQHSYLNGGYVDLVMMGLLRSEWEARASAADEPRAGL